VFLLRLHLAVDAEPRRAAGLDVQVGRPATDHGGKQILDVE